LDENHIISSQPLQGDSPSWSRQAIWMFNEYQEVNNDTIISAESKYDSIDSEITFNFEMM